MQLGWIDFSKKERSKILSVLELLSEKGTLDELGIADIRDGFSNRFFPGTSTIQTRAKYFLIVPYSLKQLEKIGESNPYKVLKELDKIERECAKSLFRKNEKEDGLIGINALKRHSWVKRTPADIYWAGLRRYGIFTGENLSLSEYVKISCVTKTEKDGLKKLGNRHDNAEENDCDDKNAGDLSERQFWKIPIYRDNWMDDLSMKLTYEEACFLKEQIIVSCKGTMIAYILENNITEFLECSSFQDMVRITDRFPDDMREDYKLAYDFSQFAYVTRIIYNLIVSEGRNMDAVFEFERLKPDFSNISNIDVDYIFERLRIFGNPNLRVFLKQCKTYMQSGDIEKLKECISSREIRLKQKSRAKTYHHGEFNDNDWFGGKELDYRFSNAKRIIKDIMESEGKYNAESL